MDQIADLRIAFIGAGNMAASLIHGVLARGAQAANIYVADPVPAQRERFGALGVATGDDNQAATSAAEVVVLAVKPQVAGEVVQNLALRADQLLISIAAGIDLASLAAWSATGQPIVRCMPNTPALLGAGMTALYANDNCSEAQRDAAQQVLNAAGETLWVDEEKLLDAVTAVSGSGPAYFFLLMEAMIDAGVQLGLPEQIAQRLTIQTAYGAAVMARDADDPPSRLRENVTSPGGTTAAALEVMGNADLPGTIRAALTAAERRAGELALEFGASNNSSV